MVIRGLRRQDFSVWLFTAQYQNVKKPNKKKKKTLKKKENSSQENDVIAIN